MNRRSFVKKLGLVAFSIPVGAKLLSGCKDDGDGPVDAPTSGGDAPVGTVDGAMATCTNGAGSTFNIHSHQMTVSQADIDAGVAKTYTATGGHNHDVTLTAGDFTTLANNGTVVVTSGEGAGHTHQVTVTCS